MSLRTAARVLSCAAHDGSGRAGGGIGTRGSVLTEAPKPTGSVV